MHDHELSTVEYLQGWCFQHYPFIRPKVKFFYHNQLLVDNQLCVTPPYTVWQQLKSPNPLQPIISIHILCTIYLYVSFATDKENRLKSKPLGMAIISFILMILMKDSVLLLWEEIRCWLLWGFKGLTLKFSLPVICFAMQRGCWGMTWSFSFKPLVCNKSKQ